jgi:hypothetical protein
MRTTRSLFSISCYPSNVLQKYLLEEKLEAELTAEQEAHFTSTQAGKGMWDAN